MPLEDLFSSQYVVCIQTVSILQYITSHFSMEGGVGGSDPLAPSLGNSWRTTNDIGDDWASMISNINHVRLYYILHI
jgi:hypothetical protein